MMKKYILLLFCIVSVITTITAQIPYNGNRLVISHTNGKSEVMVLDSVKNLSFTTISSSYVNLSSSKTDNSSIAVKVERSEGCHSFQVTCYPASQAVDENQLEEYIKKHSEFIKEEDSILEFINLKSETQYIVAALAYDEYGLPCETSTLKVTTEKREQSLPAKIGDYLYADGTWSTELKTSKTAVAIVCSTSVTAHDAALGYTNGYAMSLREAGSKSWTLEADANESGAMFSSDNDADILDREGLSHTNTLLLKPSLHNAATATQAFADAPEGTSGWFLPAAGQWLEAFEALGGLNPQVMTRNSGIATWSKEDAASCIENMNKRMAAVGTQAYDPIGNYYWTSTERTYASAYYIYANAQYNLSLQNYYKDTQFPVRPFIAF